MSDHLQNITIPLIVNNASVHDVIFINMVDANYAMDYNILRIEKYAQWLIIAFVWTTILIASYFRYILYSYLFQQYKTKEFRPINGLILFTSILEHATLVLLAVPYTIMVCVGAPLQAFTGPWFCYPIAMFSRFVVFYSFIGGLGISVYRMIFIMYDAWVQDVITQRNVFYIVLFGGIVISSVFTLIISITDYEVLFIQTCTIMQPEKRQVLNLLDVYEQSRGNPSIYAYWHDVRVVITFCLLLMTITRIITYVILFHFLYRHDNNERLRRLLEQNVIKLRNRRNAITLVGEFCSFLFYLTFTVLLHLAVSMGDKENNFVGVSALLGGAGVTGKAVIEVLVSPSLRERLFK